MARGLAAALVLLLAVASAASRAPGSEPRVSGTESEVPSWALAANQRTLDLGLSTRDRLVPGVVLLRWRDGVAGPGWGEPVEGASTPVVRVAVPAGQEVGSASALARRPDVAWAQPDYLRRADLTPNDPRFPEQWALTKIQAPAAWDTTIGSSSVIVAVLDTGIDLRHPDLQGRLAPGRNFLQPEAPPADDSGHGTHMAGAIAATINNNLGIAGVASGVSLMPVKVLDSSGTGRDSVVAAAMHWAVDNGARIINMSFGGPEVSPIATEAVAYAAGRGAVIVVAAGNDATTAARYPAAIEPAIAVAAVTSRDTRAQFSNFGPWIDLSAPGVGILSTFWDGASTYRSTSGTSAAAALVSGVAALVLSANPGLTSAQVGTILRDTADPAAPGLGAGRVNAVRAVAAALPGALSPTPTPTPSLQPTRSPTPPPSLEPTPTPATPTPEMPTPTPAAPTPAARPAALSYKASAAAARWYLPMLLREVDGWHSVVRIQNASSSPVEVTMQLVGEDGMSQTQAIVAIPSQGSAALRLEELPLLPIRWRGGGILSSSGPVAVVALMERTGADSAAYVGLVEGSSIVHAPLVLRNWNGWDTSLAVQNLGESDALVELAAVGSLLPGWTAAGSVPLGPGGIAFISLDTDLPLPDDFAGAIVAGNEEGQPLGLVVLLRHASGAASAYGASGQGGVVLRAPLVYKESPTAGSWNSAIQLQNLGPEPIEVEVTYAAAASGEAGATERIALEGGGASHISMAARPELPPGFVGSVTITSSDGPITGVVHTVDEERSLATTYGLLVGGETSLHAPLLAKGVEGRNSGLQVQNLGAGPTPLSIRYFGVDGALAAGESDPSLADSPRTYDLLAVPSLAEGFNGSAVVTSENSEPLAGVVTEVSNQR